MLFKKLLEIFRTKTHSQTKKGEGLMSYINFFHKQNLKYENI